MYVHTKFTHQEVLDTIPVNHLYSKAAEAGSERNFRARQIALNFGIRFVGGYVERFNIMHISDELV